MPTRNIEDQLAYIETHRKNDFRNSLFESLNLCSYQYTRFRRFVIQKNSGTYINIQNTRTYTNKQEQQAGTCSPYGFEKRD